MRSFERASVLASFVTLVSLVAAVPARACAAGEIYWFTLLSEDVYGALGFYSGLFGWETVSSPTGGFVALRDGYPFAGLSAIEDRVPDASESLWLAAIEVDDVGESVATARSLGATIHEESDLPGWGRFALIEDPQGAPVLLVKPERQLGSREGFSGWRWAELWTHDPEAAAEFYERVVGYDLEDVAVDDQTYRVFRSPGGRNAGLVRLDRPEIAARWAPYVGVTDLRAILVRVWQEGGKVLREPAELENVAAGTNRVALIADPSGAALFLYQLEAEAVADPIVAADAARTSRGRAPEYFDPLPNVHLTVSIGPGWGSAYPTYPYAPFGPRF